MRRLVGAALAIAFVGALASPPTSFAAADVAKTNGSMTSSIPFFNGGLGRWEWNLRGSDGAKAAKGKLTLTVFDAPYPETAGIHSTQVRQAVEVVRTSPDTVEFSLDEATTGPGDPFWAENRYRVIDNGRTGDELWQRCWRCSMSGEDVWHLVSEAGTANVR